MVRQNSYSVKSVHEVFQVSSRSDEFGRCKVGIGAHHYKGSTPLLC